MKHLQKHALTAALVATVLSLAAFPAAAHSFKVAFVAPLSGPDAGTGKQALDGFKLATRERDAHPDETADGHLGGLDVYILVVDAGTGKGAVLARIRELVEVEQVEFIAGLVPPDWAGEIARQPSLLIAWRQLPSGAATTMDGEPFAAAFMRTYGRAPTSAAIRGYGAARWIDRALRAVAEDISDRAALRAALEKTAP